MFTDSAESAESDVEVDFDSGADGSLVANGSPDGEGGDSVGVFCESNAIGPRALGLSGSFTGGSGFLSRVVGSAFARERASRSYPAGPTQYSLRCRCE